MTMLLKRALIVAKYRIMNMKPYVILFLLPVMFAASQSRAAHPLITEDTGTQGKGRWQLELNGERTSDSTGGNSTRGTQLNGTLSYGLIDTLDLQLTQSHLRQRGTTGNASGGLDMAIDAKWRFYSNGPMSLGLKPGVTLPTGHDERGLGSGRATYGSLLILSYEPEGWAFHSHVGYRHNRNTAGNRVALKHASAALTYAATPSLRLVVDVAADTNPDPTSTRTLRQLVLGGIYKLTDSIDLDAGFRRGNDPATDRAVLMGATFRW